MGLHCVFRFYSIWADIVATIPKEGNEGSKQIWTVEKRKESTFELQR